MAYLLLYSRCGRLRREPWFMRCRQWSSAGEKHLDAFEAASSRDKGDEMSLAKVPEISTTSSRSFGDALKQRIARANKRLRNEAPSKAMRKRAAPQEESGQLVRWSLRGRTYVPVPTTASRGLGLLDEDRANSMTDEGGPPQP